MHNVTNNINTTFCGEINPTDSDTESESNQNVTKSSREFLQQVRSQFQIIKFNWLIKMTRRFIRQLHRQTTLRRVTRHTRKLTTKHSKQRTLNAWCSLFLKYQQQTALCVSIYHVKLSRRILHVWFNYSVTRLQQARQNVIEMKNTRRVKLMFNNWCDLYSKRVLQLRITTNIQHRIKRQVLRQWKQYLKRQGDILRFYTQVKFKATKSVFKTWRDKYHKRTLLMRVFTLRDVAWAHRTYHSTHHFHLLTTIFTAWCGYSRSRRLIAVSDEQQRKALCFRGVTLVVRHFYAWVDHINHIRRRCKFVVRRKKAQVKRLFSVWRGVIALRREQTLSAYKQRVYFLKAHTIRQWRSAMHTMTVTAPIQYHLAHMLRECFDSWRVMRRERELASRVEVLWSARRQFMHFHEWRALIARRHSYQRGFSRIRVLFNRMKLREAFTRWPGHAQCVKARQMSQYVQRKGRGRIRLVDVKDATDGERGDVETKSPEGVRSFVAKSRPSLLERAIAKGYVSGMHDGENIAHIHTLLSTVLTVWRDHLVVVKHYHGLSMKLRVKTNKHLLTNTLRHWITQTPLTACRVVTWIHKRNARLHDEYLYLKKSIAESNEYQLGRREIERKLGLLK